MVCIKPKLSAFIEETKCNAVYPLLLLRKLANKRSNGDKSIYLESDNRYISLNISITYAAIVSSRSNKVLKLKLP